MKLDTAKDPSDYHFPLNVDLAQNLLGKMLTHVEAMNLPQTAEKANKDLVRQTFWKWWSDVQENSMTSSQGCIAPIVYERTKEGCVYRWMSGKPEVIFE